MQRRKTATATLCLFLAGLALNMTPAVFSQQEAGQAHTPSNYLYLTNVGLKPGQSDAYSKLEADEVAALRAANAPNHYVAMWPITGSDHVLYIHGFASFADLQKNHDATEAMSKLMDTLKADNAQETALITDRHTSIYSYEKDLSLGAPVDLSKMRFMRILLFHVRSGHRQDFEHAVKLYIKAYQTALPEAHWAMFDKMYGVGSDSSYILITPWESLSAVDVMHENGKKFREALGEDQLQMLRTSMSAAVESSENNLFAFAPSISYVPDSWLTSSPDFWGKK